MAIVYRCDRCKTIGDRQEFLTDVVVPASPERDPGAHLTGAPKLLPAVEQLTVGICQDCLTKLRAFIQEAA